MSGYELSEAVAQILGCSVDTVLRKVAACEIPHRKIGGVRRILFVREELDAWINGAELEIVDAPNGGRVVRPIQNGGAS